MCVCFIFDFLLPNLGRSGNSDLFYFLGLQNHFAWWLQPWNSKTFIPWKENYDKPRKIKKKEKKVKLLVVQSYLTICNPMDYSLPGSSVHGISQMRILQWVAVFYSRGSSRPRNPICISLCLLHEHVDSLSLHHLGSPLKLQQI